MSVLDDLAVKAGDDDVVAGVPARLVAAPASTEEAAALIAAARDLTVVIRGGGTKIHHGPPPRELDLIIDTRRLAGVVEHAAGDLITVVRAGTPMAELHNLPGQQLALDAPAAATAGGTVAANASGPRRLRYGTARDLLIGITVVRPDGRITKSGGKVVKNVAGYDLGKLYTGSQGTLGLITECVFRLHPVPLFTAFVRAVAPPTHAANVLAGQSAVSALEVNAAPGTEPEIAVLIEGTETGVRDRAAALARLLDGEVSTTPPPWWDAPPCPAGPDTLSLKATSTLSGVPALISAAVDAGLTIRGSAGSGVLYAGGTFPAATRPAATRPAGTGPAGTGPAATLAAATGPAVTGPAVTPAPGAGPGSSDEVARVVDRLRVVAAAAGGHVVVLSAPDSVRDRIDMWGPVPGVDLMRRVKDQFDPDHRFAPGRFVGGI